MSENINNAKLFTAHTAVENLFDSQNTQHANAWVVARCEVTRLAEDVPVYSVLVECKRLYVDCN